MTNDTGNWLISPVRAMMRPLQTCIGNMACMSLRRERDMTLVEELMQAALTAPDELKARALRVLRGVPLPTPVERDTEKYLTLKECAKRLGVSACSLWRWQVPGHELGGRPKFRLSEIEAYLQTDAFRRRAAELREQDRARRGGAK